MSSVGLMSPVGAPLRLREELGELVYVDTLKPREKPVQRVPEVVAGIRVDTLPRCAGSCGRKVVTTEQYNASEPARLRRRGVRRIQRNGYCKACLTEAIASGKVKRHASRPPKRMSVKDRFDVPAIWEEVRAANGGYVPLGERLGVSWQRARQIVKELGLPTGHAAAGPREHFLSELEHLLAMGQGIQRIAEAFSLTPDELVAKVHRLADRGHTRIRFEYWEINGRSTKPSQLTKPIKPSQPTKNGYKEAA